LLHLHRHRVAHLVEGLAHRGVEVHFFECRRMLGVGQRRRRCNRALVALGLLRLAHGFSCPGATLSAFLARSVRLLSRAARISARSMPTPPAKWASSSRSFSFAIGRLRCTHAMRSYATPSPVPSSSPKPQRAPAASQLVCHLPTKASQSAPGSRSSLEGRAPW